MRAAVPALLLALAACGQKADEAPKATEPAAPTLASAQQAVALTCEKDLPITAIYGTNLDGKADVALVVQGQNFNLVETPSTSGARYATADGLETGMGLAWIVTGDTAVLQQLPSDRIEDESAGQTIKTCKVKSNRPPESAAPSAP